MSTDITTAQNLAFRKALSIFPTGVTVITTLANGSEKAGITVSSFNSVSLSPPLILWSIERKAPEYKIFSQSAYFCVNVLAEDQENISMQFANPYQDKFKEIQTFINAENMLCLKSCAAWFECKTWNRYDGGDHLIIVGEVTGFKRNDKQPLLFLNGDYYKVIPKIPSGIID